MRVDLWVKGSPSQNARGNRPLIRLGFDVAPKHMLKGVYESAMPVGKLQDAADIHLLEAIENGMVCVVFVARVFQAPARFLELDILVLTVSDPRVDGGNPVFKLVFKGGQMFFDG